MRRVRESSDVYRGYACQHLATDVGLNWEWNSTKVDVTAVFVCVKEGEINAFMATKEGRIINIT